MRPMVILTTSKLELVAFSSDEGFIHRPNRSVLDNERDRRGFGQQLAHHSHIASDVSLKRSVVLFLTLSLSLLALIDEVSGISRAYFGSTRLHHGLFVATKLSGGERVAKVCPTSPYRSSCLTPHIVV